MTSNTVNKNILSTIPTRQYIPYDTAETATYYKKEIFRNKK
jgi:hypothetical protein